MQSKMEMTNSRHILQPEKCSNPDITSHVSKFSFNEFLNHDFLSKSDMAYYFRGKQENTFLWQFNLKKNKEGWKIDWKRVFPLYLNPRRLFSSLEFFEHK